MLRTTKAIIGLLQLSVLFMFLLTFQVQAKELSSSLPSLQRLTTNLILTSTSAEGPFCVGKALMAGESKILVDTEGFCSLGPLLHRTNILGDSDDRLRWLPRKKELNKSNKGLGDALGAVATVYYGDLAIGSGVLVVKRNLVLLAPHQLYEFDEKTKKFNPFSLRRNLSVSIAGCGSKRVRAQIVHNSGLFTDNEIGEDPVLLRMDEQACSQMPLSVLSLANEEERSLENTANAIVLAGTYFPGEILQARQKKFGTDRVRESEEAYVGNRFGAQALEVYYSFGKLLGPHLNETKSRDRFKKRYLYRHTADAGSGGSGGPMLTYDYVDKEWTVIGIHLGNTRGLIRNEAVKIDDEIIDILRKEINTTASKL